MELAIITIKKITEMFLIMMIGMAAFRCRIVDGPANKRMSGLTLNVIAPVTMLMSYQIGFQPERLRGLAITLALSLLSYLWSILLVNLLLPMKKGREGAVAIERIASIYSNSGFIGIPLIGGIFGEEGSAGSCSLRHAGGRSSGEQPSCIYRGTRLLRRRHSTELWGAWKQKNTTRGMLRQSLLIVSWNVYYR